MTDDGRMLSLYLMTCQHSTIGGVFRLPDGYICEDLSWDSERVAKGFAELFRKGFANRCETTKWVWICKHLEWNRPENPNQRKACAKLALSVPDECSWKLDFMRVYGEVLAIETPKKPNPSETLPEPFLNQKQKQKQKQDICAPPEGVAEKVWQDFLKIRKAKKSPMTDTALEGIRREAERAGCSLETALETCCERGWQGFQADWVQKKPELATVGGVLAGAI